ncbi:MAG: class I lanthipeptide [Crocinitomicaceae bacterium]|nr:class I lanthipeptide [Crocinitomicaceae bacterium]
MKKFLSLKLSLQKQTIFNLNCRDLK